MGTRQPSIDKMYEFAAGTYKFAAGFVEGWTGGGSSSSTAQADPADDPVLRGCRISAGVGEILREQDEGKQMEAAAKEFKDVCAQGTAL